MSIATEISRIQTCRNNIRATLVELGMAKNNDLVAAFTLLYNRFKKMFAVAVGNDGGAALGIKPYMATKLKEEAASFSKPKLKSLVDLLADVDYGYKTGSISQYDALYSFVTQATAK
ncbi:MAG: hypothetical protein K2M48_02065 [Clostridiales bacterium]|nr:hypothetical protein [Clostridiales bacterium]